MLLEERLRAIHLSYVRERHVTQGREASLTFSGIHWQAHILYLLHVTKQV